MKSEDAEVSIRLDETKSLHAGARAARGMTNGRTSVGVQFVLTGKPGEDTVQLIASCGHRAAAFRTKGRGTRDTGGFTTRLGRRTIRKLAGGTGKDPWLLRVRKNAIGLARGGQSEWCPVERTLPNDAIHLERIFTDAERQGTGRVWIDRKQALAEARAAQRNAARWATLVVSDGQTTITPLDGGGGNNPVRAETTVDGARWTSRARYLRDAFRALTAPRVEAVIGGPYGPVLFVGHEGRERYVIVTGRL